jgi:hypothetical protein
VRDLVAGSGLRFQDRGSRQLKGLPEALHLFAAEVYGVIAAVVAEAEASSRSP